MYSGGTQRNTARDRIIDREVAKLELKTPARDFKQFGTITTITGYAVIDNATGHPVVNERDSRRSAAGIAHSLNMAAMDGPEALARALGSRR